VPSSPKVPWKDRKDHRSISGCAPRFGQDGARLPPALFIDKIFDYLVFSWSMPLHDGFRGVMDTSCSPLRPRKGRLLVVHRIRFPNADMTSSTARSAVRLASSITGFHLHHFERDHLPGIADHFHCQCASR